MISIARDVSSRRRSAVEVTQEALSRIGETDASVLAFLEVTAEQALEEAKRADARVEAGESLALAGVPMAIKDNMWVAGRTATCASKILQGYRPPGDATIILAASLLYYGIWFAYLVRSTRVRETYS